MTTQTQKPSTAKKTLIGITLLIVLVVFAAVVGMQQFIKQKKAEAAANMPEPVHSVTAMTVEAREWTPMISTIGTIRPHQGAMLSAQTAGTVSKVLVESGTKVQKGQLLVEIDSSVERASLKASEAQLPSVQANYNRYRNLVASNSASNAELDNARSSYEALVANIEALKAQIERRQIYAPFDGVAGIVNVNVGQFITAGTEIVRVEDQSQMKIRFSLPQTDLEKIFVGQKVTATIDALPAQTFPAKIIAIDPAVDNTSGLINLEAVVTEGQQQLLSGMFARLNVALTTQHSQVVVPQITVSYTMYGETVYLIEPLSEQDKERVGKMAEHNPSIKPENTFRVKQVEVKTLERNGIYAHLGKGIKVGDRIVTSGFQRLSNNALVSVVEQEAVGVNTPSDTKKL